MIVESADSLEHCVGCGAAVPRVAGPTHRYMTAAPGCWAMHGELSAHLLQDPHAILYRQLCVDAYAVQHPGSPNPQAIQSVAVHLLSLYAQLERGFSGPAAPGFIQRAVQRKHQYHWLPPPSFDGVRTLGHVLAHLDRPAIAAHEWATDAWQAWALHGQQVEQWYVQLMEK